MKNKGMLSISELAKYARISRTALLHYDHMGLISPVERGENNYRYYSYGQITIINLIVTLQELGVPLKEIVHYIEQRTPQSIAKMLTEQSKQIRESIERLQQAEKLLLSLKNIIEGVIDVDEQKIEVRWEEAESILLGPQIDYSGGKSIKEATYDFYKFAAALDQKYDLNYPVWAVYSAERLKRGDWVGPDRFYFIMPDGPDKKPAALYLTGYTRGDYGCSNALYQRLLAYADEHGLEICGPAYETYPLNEISVVKPSQYLMRISITVK